MLAVFGPPSSPLRWMAYWQVLVRLVSFCRKHYIFWFSQSALMCLAAFSGLLGSVRLAGGQDRDHQCACPELQATSAVCRALRRNSAA